MDEVVAAVRAQLEGPSELALFMVSRDHQGAFEQLGSWLAQGLSARHLLGCTGESIVGTGREIEDAPALSLWAGQLPQTQLYPMHLTLEQTPEGGIFTGWPDDLPPQWPAGSTLLLLGEPYTFPADYLLERLNEDQPGIPIIGGMASGASQPGENRLWWNERVYQVGALALLLTGQLQVRSLVSQGCRPIGRPFVVTRADRNVILELGGQPALAQLQEVFQTLSTTEQRMVQQGLHLGRVVSEYQDVFSQGDFLVRNVIGFSQEHQAVAVGDFFRPGQTVQFHVRDAGTADAELRQLLAQVREASEARLLAALLFTCNGRGTRLFPDPHHDAACVQAALGPLPLAGFFAAGELGPVGGKNFLHGFTASLALFGERQP